MVTMTRVRSPASEHFCCPRTRVVSRTLTPVAANTSERRSSSAIILEQVPEEASLRSSCSSRRPGQRGNAVIEFALCFGVLWACFGAACGLGYAALIYQRLHNTLLAGARYAATAPLDIAGTQFTTKVRNMVVYGTPAGGTTPFVPGLST